MKKFAVLILSLGLVFNFGAGAAIPQPIQSVGVINPVAGFLDEFRQLAESNEDYIDGVSDTMIELLKLTTDDTQLTRFMGDNEQIYQAGFGESFVPGQSGLLSSPELFPQVASLSGTTAKISNLELWKISLSSIANGGGVMVNRKAVKAYVYTARFGASPEHVGFSFTLDLAALGVVCPASISCLAQIFVPTAVIREEGPVDATTVGSFMQLSLSGYFKTPGALLGWVNSLVDPPLFSSRNQSPFNQSPFNQSAAGGDSGGGFCDLDSLAECLSRVAATLQSDLADVESDFNDRLLEKEKELAEAAQSGVTAAGTGAIGGLVGGASTGAAGGPIAAAAGAALGAALGAATGLIGWAFFGPDTDQIIADIEQIRSDAHTARCDAMKKAKDAALECMAEHCPELYELFEAQLMLALLQSGC